MYSQGKRKTNIYVLRKYWSETWYLPSRVCLSNSNLIFNRPPFSVLGILNKKIIALLTDYVLNSSFDRYYHDRSQSFFEFYVRIDMKSRQMCSKEFKILGCKFNSTTIWLQKLSWLSNPNQVYFRSSLDKWIRQPLKSAEKNLSYVI